MAKTIQEIKATADELQRRARLGQFDHQGLFRAFSQLVNHLHEAATQPTTLGPKPVAPTAEDIQPLVDAAKESLAAAETKPKRRSRVKVGSAEPPTPAVTVGQQTPETVKETPEPGAGAQKTIPNTAKVGRGVRVGNAGSAGGTKITVGSAPVNPVGQVTVGGRIVQR